MGMGYGAGYADVVSADFVRRMAPAEYQALMDAIDLEGSDASPESLDYFAECREDFPEVQKLLERLRHRFQESTTTNGNGLLLELHYHDPDNGDRYDEVSGAYWAVDGVYTKTPAGKMFEKEINRQLFVTFG